MTTPDPDRKNAPFEWRALTINKVEKIQLARLHEEQDRIEKELREQEELERAARRLDVQEREREALEQAWFEEGTAEPRDTLEDVDTQKETAAFTPLRRLSYVLAASLRRLTNPPPKPRSSVPPPPLNESPLSLSLVLAACAFGGSVYLSLRWVAEVRQAHVTQNVSHSINATAPATSLVSDQVVNSAPPTSVAVPKSPATSPVEPFGRGSATHVGGASAATVNSGVSSPSTGAVSPSAIQPPSSARINPGLLHSPGLRSPGAATSPASSVAAESPPAPAIADVTDSAPARPVNAQQTPRSRVLVPAAGSPHSSGTRVYRGGE